MSPPRAGRLVTAWQGPLLGPHGPHGRGTEPDPQRGVEPTRALLCFSWVVLGVCSECRCGRDRNSPRGPGSGEHGGDPRPTEPMGCGMCGYSPGLRVMLLLCLGFLGGMGCAPGPSQGVHTWALGKPTRCGTGALRVCGEAVGTALQWGQPTRVCVPRCTPLLIVREGKAFLHVGPGSPRMPASLPRGGA